MACGHGSGRRARSARKRRPGSEGGFTIVESAIASALGLVVVSAILVSLSGAQRTQAYVDRLSRAVATARGGVDQVSREARAARELNDLGSNAVEAWFDADADGIRQPGETVMYSIKSAGGGLQLVRQTDAGDTRPLATDLVAGSSVTVEARKGGRVLVVSLLVDPDPTNPPEATQIQTEVLARNAKP